MKQITYMTLLAVLMLAYACHQDEDDIFTVAEITVVGGDTISIDRIQATAQLTDMNAKRTTTSADFNGSVLRVQLLRSSYSISIEGLVRYTNRQGAVSTKRMRAYSDFVDFSAKGYNQATLNLIFLE